MRHQQREEFAIGFLIWSLPVVSHAEDTDGGPLLKHCRKQGGLTDPLRLDPVIKELAALSYLTGTEFSVKPDRSRCELGSARQQVDVLAAVVLLVRRKKRRIITDDAQI